MAALVTLPTELLLLIASCLDNVNDKLALAGTCRHLSDATRPDLHRLHAVDRHANAAFWAGSQGDMAVLEALWPYNPRLVNRYWEVDPDALADYESLFDQAPPPCPVCQVEVCQHPPYPDPRDVDQDAVKGMLGTVELSRVTACFEHPWSATFTLLHAAALHNDVDQISWLLDHGASIDAPCAIMGCRETPDDGEHPILTALQLALCNRHEEAARLLIERGASLGGGPAPCQRGPERRPQLEPCTPAICVAAAFGVSAIVTLLLDKGTPIDERDHWGYTALHHAVDRCWQDEYLGVFKVLLDAGADLNDRNNARHRNPLEMAFRQGNFLVVNHLLSLGATLDQVNPGDGDGGTGLGLLHFACAFEAWGRALRYSLHSCFSNSRLDNETFTEAKWEASRHALVARLLDLGYDPNSKADLTHPWCRDDNDGYIPPRGQSNHIWWEARPHSKILRRTGVTALNAVASDCSAHLVDLLLSRGAEVDAADSKDMTLLWMLCASDSLLDALYPDQLEDLTLADYTYEWEEKTELVLRAGAKLDPFGDPSAGSPSQKALDLMSDLDQKKFGPLMKMVTSRNVSEQVLGCVAGWFFTEADYGKALYVLEKRPNVKLDATKYEPETWSVPNLNEYTAEKFVIPLLSYPLEKGVREHLERALCEGRRRDWK